MILDIWHAVLRLVFRGRRPAVVHAELGRAAIEVGIVYDVSYPRDRAAQWQMWRQP